MQWTRAETSAWRLPQACTCWAGQLRTATSWSPIPSIPLTRIAGWLTTISGRRRRVPEPYSTGSEACSQDRFQWAASTLPWARSSSSVEEATVIGNPPAPVWNWSIRWVSWRAYSSPPGSRPTNHVSASGSPPPLAGARKLWRIHADDAEAGSSSRRCHAS